METQNSAAVPQDLPRMTLTQQEYEVARGLVAKRPNTFSEAGVDSKKKLQWNNPDEVIVRGEKLNVPFEIKGVGDLATWARTTSTSELIQFLTTPSDYYDLDSMIFGNRYVRAWLELEYRVSVFERKLIEGKEIAEHRAARAERRARIGTMIAIVSLLIAAISLALRFFGRT